MYIDEAESQLPVKEQLTCGIIAARIMNLLEHALLFLWRADTFLLRASFKFLIDARLTFSFDTSSTQSHQGPYHDDGLCSKTKINIDVNGDEEFCG
jgi:hypothetical protein